MNLQYNESIGENAREWFGTWFDSPFYHMLYKNRDYAEAQRLIDNISDFLKIGKENKILDLACGKGRHSIYLNSKGYDVVGLDLSRQNILHANQFQNKRLKFFEHDMREPFSENEFCFVLNLFTSFGYFELDKEDEKVIQAMVKNLKPSGQLLIDFLNPYKVIHNLVPSETINREGISFHISKSFQDGFIIKDIRFEHEKKSFHFQEKVKAIRRFTFEKYFKNAGLELQHTFGDYDLNPYDKTSSDRMIFVCKK